MVLIPTVGHFIDTISQIGNRLLEGNVFFGNISLLSQIGAYISHFSLAIDFQERTHLSWEYVTTM
jgi:hypothetical protein